MIYEMLSGINPFKLKNKNKFEKLQMIMEEDIKMLPMFSRDAADLLTQLLQRNVSYPLFSNLLQPKERLGSGPDGAKELKEHIFFSDTDWDDVLAKRIAPPFVPAI
jgi:serine/threonine protein kinase